MSKILHWKNEKLLAAVGVVLGLLVLYTVLHVLGAAQSESLDREMARTESRRAVRRLQDEELLRILHDPESKTPLQQAAAEELADRYRPR